MLVATTLTLAGEGASDGAVYTAANELDASVPQVDPLQPAPFKLHVTAVFEVPATVAVNESVLAAGTEALVGLMLSKTAVAATRVTLAEADLVGSATLVTVTRSVAGEGTLAGGVYSPPLEMLPHAAPLQPPPLAPLPHAESPYRDPPSPSQCPHPV